MKAVINATEEELTSMLSKTKGSRTKEDVMMAVTGAYNHEHELSHVNCLTRLLIAALSVHGASENVSWRACSAVIAPLTSPHCYTLHAPTALFLIMK